MKTPLMNIMWLLITVASVNGHANATTLYKLDNQTTTTAVSGADWGNYDWFGGTRDFKAIHRITNWESSNNPCKMKVKMRHLNKYTSSTDSHSFVSGGCNKDKISVGYDDPDTYIRGVQVCNSNGIGEPIKGLRVWGSRINRVNGALTNVARDQDKRNNCAKWKKTQYCPAGQIVAQIKVSHIAPDYTGIGLICREVVVK